ncbi:hypothetical protein X777_03794 [Ooceraea biroi]|uniref:Uncharacterized protein n=1 Tax=Ooceraea biroi TaxID=2015173 RepID=A0A026WHN5_OOCBI|nr:hypothetical protein X777_03794 [Ooceraea biroi]
MRASNPRHKHSEIPAVRVVCSFHAQRRIIGTRERTNGRRRHSPIVILSGNAAGTRRTKRTVKAIIVIVAVDVGLLILPAPAVVSRARWCWWFPSGSPGTTIDAAAPRGYAVARRRRRDEGGPPVT